MNNSSNSSVGSPTLWDKIEIGYSLLAALIGLPLNLFILARLLDQHLMHLQIAKRKHNRLTLLSLQINIADIMILTFKCIAYSIWMIVQAWKIGDIACKIYQFLLMLPFYLSSNSRVSLALDMYQSIHFPMSIRITANRYARIYIAVSWTLALLFSLPQVYFFQATPVPPGNGFWQCYNRMLLKGEEGIFWINAYDLYHLLLVFWIPLICIVILYASITREAFRALNSQKRMKMGQDEEQHGGKTRLCCSSCLPHKSNSSPDAKCSTDTVAMPLLVQQTSKLFECAESKDEHQDVTAKLQQQVERRNKAESMAREAQHRARAQKLKILNFSLSIIGAYVACWLPYQVKALIDLQSTRETRAQSDIYWHWLSAVMIFNSCLNPILYGFGQTTAAGRSHGNPKRDSTLPSVMMTGQSTAGHPITPQ